MRILKKISLACFVSIFIASNTFAMSFAIQELGAGIEYKLPSHDPKVFDNFMFNTVKACCTIVSEHEENSVLELKVLRKNGSLNGTHLSAGDAMDLLLNHGDKFVFSLESGAKIRLTNKSDETIKAHCSIL